MTSWLLVCAALVVFAGGASAALECSDMQFDVTWRTRGGEIDLSSVCFDFEAKPAHAACRRFAVKAFEARGARGRANDNPL